MLEQLGYLKTSKNYAESPSTRYLKTSKNYTESPSATLKAVREKADFSHSQDKQGIKKLKLGKI